MLSSLFLLACMRFMLFVRVKSSRKKKIKRPKISLDNLNLHTTDVYFSQPTPGELFARQYFSIIIIFFHYHNTIQWLKYFSISTIFFNDYKILPLSQYFSIITIPFNDYNIFPLSKYPSMITIFFHYHNISSWSYYFHYHNISLWS